MGWSHSEKQDIRQFVQRPILNTDFKAGNVAVPRSSDFEVNRYHQALGSNPNLSPQSIKTASTVSLAKGDASQANLNKTALTIENARIWKACSPSGAPASSASKTCSPGEGVPRFTMCSIRLSWQM